jgi:hypothetical protein
MAAKPCSPGQVREKSARKQFNDVDSEVDGPFGYEDSLAYSHSVPQEGMVAAPAGLLKKEKAKRTPADTLEAIVSLQTFEGYWEWSDKLYELLHMDRAAVEAFPAGLDTKSSIVATACVLAFLEAKMASEKDEWEMLVEKSTRWLAAQLSTNSQTTVEELVGAAKKLI